MVSLLDHHHCVPATGAETKRTTPRRARVVALEQLHRVICWSGEMCGCSGSAGREEKKTTIVSDGRKMVRL
jgi:hypothetical protein